MWMPIYNLFVAVLGLHLKLSNTCTNTQSHCKGFWEKTTTSQKNKKSELVNRENDSLHAIRFDNVQRCASKNSTVIASFSSHSTPNQEW